MTIFTLTQADRRSSENEIQCSNMSVLPIGTHYSLLFDPFVTSRSGSANWEFIWYGEHNTQPDFKRVESLLEAESLTALWGMRGVLIAVKRNHNLIYIFNDCFGAFPIFFNNSEDSKNALISDSLQPFTGSVPDWVSFYQFLCFGYTIGGYSLYKDVQRLKANHGLKIEVNDSYFSARSFPLKNFWVGRNYVSTRSVNDLIDIVRTEANMFEEPQLMMSGGWDSRLLLAALEKRRPELYTHGDLHSREIAIVRDIAQLCGLPLVERAFDPSGFDSNLFRQYLARNESAMFTHWDAAGHYAQNKNLVMTAGTFGEMLGGHYGTINVLPGKKKYLSLLLHMMGVGGKFDHMLMQRDSQVILNYLKVSSYHVFWFLNEELREALKSKNLIEESNQRLEELFTAYQSQGMDDIQLMFERYYTEHRGGQYINRQLTNAARGLNYRNIFTNKDLVETVASIPFSMRAHNKLNKAIIQRLKPELLKFPMAATLTSAKRPLLMQELSRAARKVVEGNSRAYKFYSAHSRYGDCRFGWNNFRDIVQPEWIDELMPLLSPHLWDTNKLKQAIVNGSGDGSYPLFDMISKAITLGFFNPAGSDSNTQNLAHNFCEPTGIY
ncbi:asparagine synthase-related protein [Alteromonas ponticola]|uniref:asparagine synthase (glutamine-hydrolyzing) n=1 Tax=Alteromonas ponticola TaxID=2720613 RepID=A0ABX1R4Z2_9ALTE|nr:asparagine synthase-related protein [Alteromonas ponticola]NMH61502.1 hypothetical protein [Alteromonas ponticola]